MIGSVCFIGVYWGDNKNSLWIKEIIEVWNNINIMVNWMTVES